MKMRTRKENLMQFKPKFLKLLLAKQNELGREIKVSEIADATGLARQTVYNWKKETPFDNLDSDTADSFKKFFNCALDDLVDLVPSEKARKRLIAK